MKRFCYLLAAIVVCIILLTGGCASAKEDGFAIYLTRDNVPPAQLLSMSNIAIADQPLIAMKDIITYNAQTHELKLTEEAFQRITDLEVPTNGKSFAVCVNKKPVYAGAFWTPVSSQSFNEVTIWKSYSTEDSPSIVTLELGYPTSDFYNGADPRNSPEILASLKKAGKLIDKLTIEMVKELPGSMKGYELYSWSEGSQWSFTLITGTNRNKSFIEITSGEDFISEAGWVKVSATGVDEIETVLNKLPAAHTFHGCPGYEILQGKVILRFNYRLMRQ